MPWPFFSKMGHGIVHFGRGGRFRFFLENLMIFRYFWNSRCFSVFSQNPVIFLIPIGFCGHFPAKCYSWAQTLNSRVPFFFDEQRGRQTFKNTPSLGVQCIVFFAKSARHPMSSWPPWCTTRLFFWENELWYFHAYSLIKYMECQIDYTQIGTQTLQKRKSWGARTWELVGTEFPRLQILRGNWPPLTGPTHIWTVPRPNERFRSMWTTILKYIL